MLGADCFASGVHQHEAARAVRIFGFSFLKASLAEQSGLLITGGSRDNYFFTE
ncbi:hypothetical protein D3C73_1004400 [compost metagenome]